MTDPYLFFIGVVVTDDREKYPEKYFVYRDGELVRNKNGRPKRKSGATPKPKPKPEDFNPKDYPKHIYEYDENGKLLLNAHNKPKKRRGRKTGTKKEVTDEARRAISAFVNKNSGKLQRWLDDVAVNDPEKAFQLFMSVVEYHIPKLARVDNTVEHKGDVTFVVNTGIPAPPNYQNKQITKREDEIIDITPIKDKVHEKAED